MSVGHGNLVAGSASGIHTAPRWVVADASARLAIVVAPADVGGIVLQLDTATLYWLADDSPKTWKVFGDVTAADLVLLEADIAVALAAKAAAARLINSGGGLVGGGSLAADRTLAVGAHADGSIVVNADDVQIGALASDAQHGVRGGGTQHAAATTSVSGFLAAADKAKLELLDGYDWENAEIFLGRPSIGSSTVPLGVGVTYSGVGSAGANVLSFDGGGVLSYRPRVSRQTSAVAGTLAELYTLGQFLFTLTGYHYVKDFGFNPQANCRIFAGILASGAALTNVSIDSLVNMIGLGRLDGSPNLHLFCNDATGTASAIDLGASYPASTGANHLYRLTLDCVPGGATVAYKVEKFSGTPASVTGTLSANLPTQYIALGDRLFGTNNIDSAVVTLMFARMFATSRPT